MTISAFLEWPDFGSGGFGFVMVEVVVTPAIARGIPFSVFDGYVGAIKRPRKESAPRGLSFRAVRTISGQHELQFLYEYCSFGEDARVLIDFVGTRFDVYIVEFWEVCMPAI